MTLTEAGSVSAKPVYFSLERYMHAYAIEWSAFVDACVVGKEVPATTQYGANASGAGGGGELLLGRRSTRRGHLRGGSQVFSHDFRNRRTGRARDGRTENALRSRSRSEVLPLSAVTGHALLGYPHIGRRGPCLVLASVAAFALSESADLAVSTPLQRKGLVLAVAASGVGGIMADSLLFLWLAFGSLDFLWGQVIGKGWALLLALPAIHLLRLRDRRLGFAPA